MHDCICSGRILEEIWDFEEAAEDVYPEESGGLSQQLLMVPRKWFLS